jgi:ectoine hydroxylase-related dioxygenase (phytanoyl-CoA dioxygenase family)
MKTKVSKDQVKSFQKDGFLVIEDFLDQEELEHWRTSVKEALEERDGLKIPGKKGSLDEDDGINEDTDYYNKVFDQSVNLWQTSEKMKKIMFDSNIGKMVSDLSGADGVRIWHDQALVKRPWANPTAWHLDTPYWSFTDRRALSIWVALDDATLENGCLFFIPGTHKKTTFKNPGIGKNMDAIFDFYPQFKTFKSIPAVMKAGSCSFHNGLTIHGACANMTPGYRRAMTCAYMPDGNVYNGQPNVLPESYLQKLNEGDLLKNDDQNPLIFKKEV